MFKFCSLKNVSIDQIYLEAGKGKGTADGIGAVVKRAFTDIILQHLDSKFESVANFLQYLPSYIQSTEIFHFTKEDVMEKRNIVPELLSIKATGKCCQVLPVLLNRNIRMEIPELSNMPAKEFSFKTLQKYNKVTIQSDNDDERDESVNDDECINDDDDESNNVEIRVGDYVMVIHEPLRGYEPFRGYFSIVTDKSYGDEFEIQYFKKKKKKWWILKENDFDSRLANELKPVKRRIDEKSHYLFKLKFFSKHFLEINLNWVL